MLSIANIHILQMLLGGRDNRHMGGISSHDLHVVSDVSGSIAE